METKSITFQTGVVISIDKNEIIAKDNSGMDKMETKNLDSFSYEQYIEPKISPSGLCTIPLIIGFLMMVISGGDSNRLGLFLVIIGGLGFIFIFFDAMLQLNLARNLIARVWSHKGYAVTIGNKSGNNLLFYTQIDELNKVKSIESILDELKAQISSDNEVNKPHHPNNPKSNLDELEQLAKLRDNKVITEDEFNQKKKELLGL